MSLVYVGYSMNCVILQGRKFTKKDLGKVVEPPLKNEEMVAEQYPLAFVSEEKAEKIKKEKEKQIADAKAKAELVAKKKAEVKAEDEAKEKAAQDKAEGLKFDDGVEAREKAKRAEQAIRDAGPKEDERLAAKRAENKKKK